MQKITVKEYAQREKIGVQAVYKRIREGNVTSEKIGRNVFVIIDEDKVFQKEEKQVKENKKSNQNGLELFLKEQLKEKENQIAELKNNYESRIKDKNDFIEAQKQQILIKDKQIEELNFTIRELMEQQRNSVEVQKQQNSLMGAFQKALGFLEKPSTTKNHETIVVQEKENKKEPSKKKKKKGKKKKK